MEDQLKKLAAAMTLIGALAPAFYSVPAKAWDCDGCSYPVRHTSVVYKPVVYHTISYRPVVHTHVYYKPFYHHYFRHHCCCYCCGHVSAYPDVQDSYVFTYN